MKKVKLGKSYRDTITKAEGLCTGIHKYLTGCTRVSIERLNAKTGDLQELTFDITRLEEVDANAKPIKIEPKKNRTGGFKPIDKSISGGKI